MKVSTPITEEKPLIKELLTANDGPYQLHQDSILEIAISEIDVIGQGNSLREAYTHAFVMMKKQAYKKFNNFIIHLTPIDVIEIADEKELRVKNLFGFFPRKKMFYEIKLKIVVQTKYIKIV